MLIFFLIFTAFFIITVEVFTILFQLTGLSRSKALFQVISIITSTGFTTKESEIITFDDTRRKLAQYLMVFSYISTLLYIVLLITFFTNDYEIYQYISFFLVLLSYPVIYSIKSFRNTLRNIVEVFGNKLLFGSNNNSILILEEFGNYVIAQIIVNTVPEALSGVALKDIDLYNAYHIMITTIVRKNATITNVTDDYKIKSGDKIIAYGDNIQLAYLFQINTKK